MRPPPSVDDSEALTVGVDIGGTKVLAGVVDAAGRVLDRDRRVTPGDSAASVEAAIVDLVRSLGTDRHIGAVGVGAAGFVDEHRSRVVFAPHLAWRDEPLRDALQDRLGLPVVVDNDANTAALAEAQVGTAAGHRFVLCVTLGTGIGGALVLDHAIFRGANGMAGEFGHMQVVPDGARCPCGNRGCWEQYASGTALVREARELVLDGSPSAARLRELGGADAVSLTGPLVTQAARAGDPLSRELLGEMGRWLGIGLANLAAAFDPHCIVVGGGVSEAADLFLGSTREVFARHLVGHGHRVPTPIVPAALGADAGFVGAALMARAAVPAHGDVGV